MLAFAQVECPPIPAPATDVDAESQRRQLTQRLAADFAATARILDPRFFAAAAREYANSLEPSEDGLDELVRGFPHFLATYPPCRWLRYVGDFARFELLVREVLRAPESCLLDRHLLAVEAVAPTRLSLALSPAYGLLCSFWPLDRIWRVPDAYQAGRLAVEYRQRQFEIWRQDGQLLCGRLSVAEYRFRRALQMGVHLAAATAAALDADRDFDVTAALADLSRQGVVIGFTERPRGQSKDPLS